MHPCNPGVHGGANPIRSDGDCCQGLTTGRARSSVRRGQGYTLRVTTAPAVHRGLLARCQPLDGTQSLPAVPAQRKARREYENRVSALTP